MQDSDLTDWLNRLPEIPPLTPADIAKRLERLGKTGGLEKLVIGKSQEGRDIEALHLPGEGERLLAWGFPHPDEPLGALALVMLSEGIIQEGRPPGLEEADIWLVPVADPDQAELNRDWIESLKTQDYLEGNWRPLYSGLEVDYHFPIMHPPFYQPRDRNIRGMEKPLPESLALADLIDRVKPKMLGLMHSNHVSGSYTYLSHRPDSQMLEEMEALDRALGVPEHRGERPDPGKRWKTGRPDLLKEERLQERQRKAEKKFGSLKGKSLVGCVSAAQYLESLDAEALVVTPEIGLWRPEGIDDLRPTEEIRMVRKVSDGSRQRWYGVLEYEEGVSGEVCYHTFKQAGEIEEITEQAELTRGMAGVEAIELRRYFLRKADLLWQEAMPLLEKSDSPWLQERRSIRIAGERVNDKSMLIFRSDPGYRRRASVAEEIDLRLRWGMQSCLWLGHSLALYRHHRLDELADRQAELLARAKRRMLREIPEEIGDTQSGALSQLGRLLICWQHLPGS